jgi:F-type H+-transporting ATPase subunit b
MEILQKIGFDWQIALANLVNFLIIFFILKKLFWKSIKDAVAKRRALIEQGLLDAQKAKTDLMMAEEIREARIREAKHEANEIVMSATSEKNAIIEKSKDEARVEGAIIIAKAHKDAENLQVKMKNEFTKEAVELVLSSTEKLLKEKIDSAKNSEIISKIISEKKE